MAKSTMKPKEGITKKEEMRVAGKRGKMGKGKGDKPDFFAGFSKKKGK